MGVQGGCTGNHKASGERSRALRIGKKAVAMTKTPQTKQEVFEKHVPYEVDRLLETYELLLEPKRYRSALAREITDTVEDALMVGFCTHARNLLEFFFRENNKNNCAIAL